MKMRFSTIVTLVICAAVFVGVMWLISIAPVAPATPTPMPTLPCRRFDAGTEAYLWGLEQSPTGRSLVRYLRAGDIAVEWVDTLDGLPAVSDVGVIKLAHDEMTEAADLEVIKAAVLGGVPSEEIRHALDLYVADCAVLAHEVAHHVMGDPKTALPDNGSPARQRAEWRVRVVEIKVVCEMVALARGQKVDYYHSAPWEVYATSMPDDPTDLEGLLVGAQPDDMSLARRLLAFPARSGQ